MRRPHWWFILGWLALCPSLSLLAQETASSEPPANFLFRDQFYLSASEKVRRNATAAAGFLLVEQPDPQWNSKIAVVSGFAPKGKALRTQTLKDMQTMEEARDWLKAQKKETDFEGVPVAELPLPLPDGRVQSRFWVGNKSFPSLDQASAEIAMIQSIIRSQGGDFARAVAIAGQYSEPAEETQVPEEKPKTQAQFQQEEEWMLRWSDQLNLGEKLWGPFMGVPAGEPILYQSFGETTWRSTNLSKRDFNSQVGFWTNRIVLKGIRFPFSTIDPFVDLTVAPEATGNAGGNQLDTVFGVEWRPFVRNAWLENFKPWGLPLLKFAKNYRFVIEYLDRRNLKDEILNIRDYDTRIGVDIFYEWGIELPPIDQGKEKGLAGFLSTYTWGEYFGDYKWRQTNFTGEKVFNAWILDSSLTLGMKVPVMKLRPNPVNDQLLLMPYLRFGLTTNTEFSNPSDNRYFVAVGLRWMPFRDYRFANNEWLFKTKVFAEYLAIGKVQNLKQDDSRPWPDEDWRIGVAWSLRRY